MIYWLIALVLAGTLLMPRLTPASGNDGSAQLQPVGYDRSHVASDGAIPLPPIPHLETMPWLVAATREKGPKVDLLLGPAPETVGPFVVQPLPPTMQVSTR